MSRLPQSGCEVTGHNDRKLWLMSCSDTTFPFLGEIDKCSGAIIPTSTPKGQAGIFTPANSVVIPLTSVTGSKSKMIVAPTHCDTSSVITEIACGTLSKSW